MNETMKMAMIATACVIAGLAVGAEPAVRLVGEVEGGLLQAKCGEKVTFRFGAHIFNFNQLGRTEWNDAYKASYGRGGIFNQATVAFYWSSYEPEPGQRRAHGLYEDSEAYSPGSDPLRT